MQVSLKGPNTYGSFLATMEHLHLELTDRFSAFLNGTPYFGKEVYWRGLGFCEDVYMIRRHTFLCDKDLFGSVYDEISPRIVWTLVEVEQILILETFEDAKRRS